MTSIENKITAFLETIEDANVSDELIEEFGEQCKKAIRECLLSKRSEEPFKLRMSNIGKPLRQLGLEKLYGRQPLDSNMRLRMTYGFMWESFMLFLIKASGMEIETNKQVSLDVEYEKGKVYTINGTLDLKIDGVIYDIKSASPWSFDNKFTTYDNIVLDDPFGYVGQGFGYSLADKSYFGGWIVADKSDGRRKLVEVPRDNYKVNITNFYTDLKHKISVLENPNFSEADLPPCEGEVEETFNRSKTGNKHLNKTCGFCDHKYKCHPGLVFQQSIPSKAKKLEYKFYTHIEKIAND